MAGAWANSTRAKSARHFPRHLAGENLRDLVRRVYRLGAAQVQPAASVRGLTHDGGIPGPAHKRLGMAAGPVAADNWLLVAWRTGAAGGRRRPLANECPALVDRPADGVVSVAEPGGGANRERTNFAGHP